MMNIKRFIILVVCLISILSFTSFAVDYDAYYYQNDDGTRGHDTEAYEHDLAVEMLAERGLDLDVETYWYIDDNADEIIYYFDLDGFLNDLGSIEEVLPPSVVDDPVINVVDQPVLNEDIIEYEVIDELEDDLSEIVLEVPEGDPVLELENVVPSVYLTNDLRGSDYNLDLSEPDGIKSVIRSIFGTYEPVKTTKIVTETVDGDIVTTLIDVVADGSSGIDYEYLAGVFLFGIMLFCLFKLLGGILS